MKSFFRVKSVEEVLELINRFDVLEAEMVSLDEAAGRVLAEDVSSKENLPDFDRSTMDGFAVRARDTFGASEGLPAMFTVQGEIPMGVKPEVAIGPGQTVRIWTGGMLPSGADAVVMIEYSRLVDGTTVELARPVAPYDNVIRQGEDLRLGQVLLSRGRRLRPQDLGLLAAQGLDRLSVVKTPRAAVISTGDEIVPVNAMPGPGQIRDVNSYTLGALVESAHGRAVRYGLVNDDPEHLKTVVARAMEECDLVLISGGSSVGRRDYTVEVLGSFPGSEILVHGVSVSPGKPTIMASIGSKSLWGLPGHTVSAMITCDLFIRPLIKKLSGDNGGPGWGQKAVAVLSRNVASVHGREDYVRVRLEKSADGLIAHPILGKSGLISTMVKADGLIRIGLHDEGLARGALVEVALFE